MKVMEIAGKILSATLVLCMCLLQGGCALGHGTSPAGKQAGVRSPRGNVDAHYLLAGYYQERGRHREAVAEFNKAITIDPLHVKAYNGLGISFSALGDLAKAMHAYETALKINPELDYLHNNLGYAHLLQGNTDMAISEFTKAAALNGKRSRVHNNLSIAYLRKGEKDKAREELAIGKGDAWAFYHLAQVNYQQDRFAEASENFTKALDVNPGLSQARKGLEASQTLDHLTKALVDNGSNTTGVPEAVKARDERTTTAPQALPQNETPKKSSDEYYVIKKGDHLVKILQTVYGLSDQKIYHQYLSAIKTLNPQVKYLSMVYPGQKIRIPSHGSALLSRTQRSIAGTPQTVPVLETAGLSPGNS